MLNITNSSYDLTPEILSYTCTLTSLLRVLRKYVMPSESIFGILTNSACVYVFVRILCNEKLNGHMFKFLLLKAIHDLIQFILQVFEPLYYCETCSTYQTYSAQVWYIWFYYYVEAVNELCSGFFELAAAFDCFIIVNNKLEFMRKNVYFYVISTVITLYSLVFYIFFLFTFRIVHKTVPIFEPHLNKTGNLTRDYFIYEYTEFSRTSWEKVLRPFIATLETLQSCLF